MSKPGQILVRLRRVMDSSYPIVIGTGLFPALAQRLRNEPLGSSYAVLSDSTVARLYGGKLLALLRAQKLKCELLTFPAGLSMVSRAMLPAIKSLFMAGYYRKNRAGDQAMKDPCPPPVFKIATTFHQLALKALWTAVPAAPLFPRQALSSCIAKSHVFRSSPAFPKRRRRRRTPKCAHAHKKPGVGKAPDLRPAFKLASALRLKRGERPCISRICQYNQDEKIRGRCIRLFPEAGTKSGNNCPKIN